MLCSQRVQTFLTTISCKELYFDIITGAEFYQTNRGGLITFHGPGQLVAYPIINLKHFKPSVRWYVCCIEQTIIELCRKLNLTANTSPHTGVWINDNKVCAIGVHCSRYVTSHGLALNCNIDLSWYKHIVPCGIQDKGVTSLTRELGKNIAITDIEPLFIDAFSEIFKCSVFCETIDQELFKKIIE